ncbi:hypothetical protein ACWEO1_16770 [Kitasatospora cineracea]
MTEALNRWHTAWNQQLDAAQQALAAALPQLETTAARECVCLGPTMRWSTPAEGSGRVCLDDSGRTTVRFKGVPTEVIGAVMLTCYGADWFGEGPAGFAGAEPGAYEYDDESTYAHYEFDVQTDGTTEISIDDERVDNIVAILDLLETALAEHRNPAQRPRRAVHRPPLP